MEADLHGGRGYLGLQRLEMEADEGRLIDEEG